MSLKYKTKKLLVRFRRAIRKKEPKMGDVQQKAYDIAINLINDPDSELMMAPITNKKYIKKGDIFVTLERGNLNIINGIYHYDVFVSDKLFDFINNKFNAKLERKRVKFEAEIKEKVTSRLTEILDNIKEK